MVHTFFLNRLFLCGLKSPSPILMNDDFQPDSELPVERWRPAVPSDRGSCFCFFDHTGRRNESAGKPDGVMSMEKCESGDASSSAAGCLGAAWGPRCTIRARMPALSRVWGGRGSGAGRGVSKAPLSTSESPTPWVEE